jgi:hypothetical protein
VHAGCVTAVPCLPQTSDSLHSERTRQCISSASFKSGISAYAITRGCSHQTRSMDLKGQLLLLELRVLCRMGLKRKLACSWNLARPMTESLNWAMPDEVSQVLEETLVSYRLLFGQSNMSCKLFRSLCSFDQVPTEEARGLLDELRGRKRCKGWARRPDRDVQPAAGFPYPQQSNSGITCHLSARLAHGRICAKTNEIQPNALHSGLS